MTIEQTQKPLMTQELIQAIRILQFNNQELNEYVENELLENPILEAKKDKTSEETVDIDELKERLMEIGAESNENRYTESWDKDREEFSFERYVAFRYSLVEHLLSQLQFSGLREVEAEIGRYLIQCIDENGYLDADIEEISKLTNSDIETVEGVLKTIQTFDPPGVGARNLQECLKIQLENQGVTDENVFYIVENRLEDIAANHISLLSKKLDISQKDVQDIADKIRGLEPKPGRLYDSDQTVKYVIPDVYVEKNGDDFIITTNDTGVPSLFISPYYYELKEEYTGSTELNKYLNDKFNSAIWLIKSIEQRKNTIYKVASAIAEYQDEFFRKGPRYLKPLTLKQIGEKVGVHESTVSRSINGKYIQCEQGVLELKYFFSGGIHSEEGEGVSSSSIKAMIKEIVESENPQKPYSDLKIAEMLGNEGIDISRRTVAKYREAVGIQSSSRRRRF